MSGPFVITRRVAAPRPRVWAAFTELGQLEQWFGPKGSVITRATLDLRPGGVFHYAMRTPDGKTMWGKWTFREILAPEKLVVVMAFSDADGGLGRHPLDPTWPRQMLSTTTFEAQGEATLITLNWSAHEATTEEQRVFDAGHDSMRAGWTGTFERLDAHLA